MNEGSWHVTVAPFCSRSSITLKAGDSHRALDEIQAGGGRLARADEICV